MGTVGLLAVHIGFAKTFIIPFVNGNFKAPFFIYVHGAFAFCWVSLFFVQALLIRYNNFRLHKIFGFIALFIALGTAITIVPAGMYQVKTELNEGLGETAISSIIGAVTSAIMYLALVIAGFINRKTPATHKRLMLLATIVVLWPAWFRFRHYFPLVQRPDIWFAVVLADSLIVISWIWDKVVNGKIHSTLLYIGTFIISEHIFEVAAFDSKLWRVVANQIYQLL
jgi:hypothetical protein